MPTLKTTIRDYHEHTAVSILLFMKTETISKFGHNSSLRAVLLIIMKLQQALGSLDFPTRLEEVL